MLSEELSNYLIETKGQIFVPAFNREVSLSIDEKCSLEYVEKVVEYVKDMPSRLINELCKGATDFFRSYLIVYQNKKNVNDIYFDFTMPLDTNGIDILNYIFPQVLRIDQPLTNEIGFAFQCECEWEPEHGMEWVVRNGETLSISWFDGLTPWDDEKNFEHYNFAPKYFKGHKEEFHITDAMLIAMENRRSKSEQPKLNSQNKQSTKKDYKFAKNMVIVMIVIFSIVIAKSILDFNKQEEFKKYPTAIAINTEIQSYKNGDDETLYTSIVNYYVDGTLYTTERTQGHTKLPEIVHYNPSNPSDYYVVTGEKPLGLIIFFSVLVIIFIIIFRVLKDGEKIEEAEENDSRER